MIMFVKSMILSSILFLSAFTFVMAEEPSLEELRKRHDSYMSGLVENAPKEAEGTFKPIMKGSDLKIFISELSLQIQYLKATLPANPNKGSNDESLMLILNNAEEFIVEFEKRPYSLFTSVGLSNACSSILVTFLDRKYKDSNKLIVLFVKLSQHTSSLSKFSDMWMANMEYKISKYNTSQKNR